MRNGVAAIKFQQPGSTRCRLRDRGIKKIAASKNESGAAFALAPSSHGGRSSRRRMAVAAFQRSPFLGADDQLPAQPSAQTIDVWLVFVHGGRQRVHGWSQSKQRDGREAPARPGNRPANASAAISLQVRL